MLIWNDVYIETYIAIDLSIALYSLSPETAIGYEYFLNLVHKIPNIMKILLHFDCYLYLFLC